MSEIPRLPVAPLESAGPVTGATPAQESVRSGRTSPAFEVLLERLEARAAELEEKSKALSGPAELPGALDAARASLAEALHLGEELLEAYRAARHESEERR